jgi:hypothetical protein
MIIIILLIFCLLICYFVQKSSKKSISKENFSCYLSAIGCCPPDSYGVDGNDCKKCPVNTKSPSIINGIECKCLNKSITDCTPCNICDRLNNNYECEPKCPGSRCSLLPVFINKKTRKIDKTGEKILPGQCY